MLMRQVVTNTTKLTRNKSNNSFIFKNNEKFMLPIKLFRDMQVREI